MGIELDDVHAHEDVCIVDGSKEAVEEGEHVLEEACIDGSERDYKV